VADVIEVAEQLVQDHYLALRLAGVDAVLATALDTMIGHVANLAARVEMLEELLFS
jgi:hypothetical protein